MAKLTVEFSQSDLGFTLDTILSIVPWESNAQSKWGIADRVIRIVLSSYGSSFLKNQLLVIAGQDAYFLSSILPYHQNVA